MSNNTIQNWLNDPDSVDENYASALAAIAPALLRETRNQLLQESDWIVTRETEAPGSIKNYDEWQAYRQALRDLPSISSPLINEFEELRGVEWPIKPDLQL